MISTEVFIKIKNVYEKSYFIRNDYEIKVFSIEYFNIKYEENIY